MSPAAILVLSLLAAVLLASFWRVIIGLLVIAALTLVFAGFFTVLTAGQGSFIN